MGAIKKLAKASAALPGDLLSTLTGGDVSPTVIPAPAPVAAEEPRAAAPTPDDDDVERARRRARARRLGASGRASTILSEGVRETLG